VKLFACAPCLLALDAPNHVDGRDKPGHDAWDLPDQPANAIRAKIFLPTPLSPSAWRRAPRFWSSR